MRFSLIVGSLALETFWACFIITTANLLIKNVNLVSRFRSRISETVHIRQTQHGLLDRVIRKDVDLLLLRPLASCISAYSWTRFWGCRSEERALTKRGLLTWGRDAVNVCTQPSSLWRSRFRNGWCSNCTYGLALDSLWCGSR